MRRALKLWMQRWIHGEDIRLGVAVSNDRITFAVPSRWMDGREPLAVYSHPLPSGVIVDGAIRDSRRLQEIVRQLSRQFPPFSERCALCIPSAIAFITTEQAPSQLSSLASSDLLAWVRSRIPIPVEGLSIALFVGLNHERDGEAVIIVATRTSDIRRYQDLFKGVGLDVDVLTLPSLLCNCGSSWSVSGQHQQCPASMSEEELAVLMARNDPWMCAFSRFEVACD